MEIGLKCKMHLVGFSSVENEERKFCTRNRIWSWWWWSYIRQKWERDREAVLGWVGKREKKRDKYVKQVAIKNWTSLRADEEVVVETPVEKTDKKNKERES